MKFNQIVVLDKVALSKSCIEGLQQYSQSPVVFYDSDPINEDETIKRLLAADCVLLSWRTAISKKVIESCTDLKYIGLCATNSDLIDLEACKKRGVAFTNVKDYGDVGVVEWILFQLLALVRGYGPYQWKDQPAELSGKTLGIIGFGTIGKMLAEAALGLGMKVIYFSRSRYEEYEERGVVFAEKKELIRQSDFITLQTPKGLVALESEDFELMQQKVLVNTTLGKAFAEEDLIAWIQKPDNYLIMDAAPDFKEAFEGLDQVVVSDYVSGLTEEASLRLSQKALDNLTAYFE